MVKDPVCGMDVNPITAKFTTKKDGETVYFCSKHCLEKFTSQLKRVEISIPDMSCASCVLPNILYPL